VHPNEGTGQGRWVRIWITEWSFGADEPETVQQKLRQTTDIKVCHIGELFPVNMLFGCHGKYQRETHGGIWQNYINGGCDEVWLSSNSPPRYRGNFCCILKSRHHIRYEFCTMSTEMSPIVEISQIKYTELNAISLRRSLIFVGRKRFWKLPFHEVAWMGLFTLM